MPLIMKFTLPSLIAVLLLFGDALAQERLTGEAAFGGWRSDGPGVTRLITPQDLPPPYASRSSGNAPGVVDRETDMVPEVPEGFAATLLGEDFAGPRTLRVAPNGDILVVESEAGRISVLEPDGGRSVFAQGLIAPYGLAFHPADDPEWVYVADTHQVVRYPYRSGEAAGEAELIVRDLPSGGHWTRDIAFSRDGATLYVAVGSQSNVSISPETLPEAELRVHEAETLRGAAWGRETDRAAVLAYSPEGERRGIFAAGLRNCSGVAVQPATGDLWCSVNERDGLGDDLPPDYATSVADGAFYGWPWFYIGGNPDPRLEGARPDLADAVTVPDVLLQAHSAPLGIAFYDGETFPEAYRGDAFVALHGSWNRSEPTGYKVVRLLMEDGAPTGAYQDFATGFVVSDRQVWGRPVGVAVDNDGALLVSEDANGTVWRITHDE